METHWHLPGYAVETLLGGSPGVEVWRGRDAGGAPVVLRRLTEAGPETVARLRRDAAVIGSAGGPHVVRIRDVVEVGGDVVVVLDEAPGGDLVDVLADRGRLSAHEVVTLLAPLAQALAAVHDRGSVHGAVTSSAVVFATDGRPMLTDFVGVGTPAGDVRGLAALGVEALSGRLDDVPVALRAALEAGLAADDDVADDGPGFAADFAAAVLDSCAAAPIGLGAARREVSAVQPAAPAPIRPRRSRLVVAVVAVALVAGAVGLGVTWGRHGRPAVAALAPTLPAATTPAPTVVASAPAVDWRRVVARLERLRSRAINNLDATRLRDVYVAGAGVGRRDVAMVERLRRHGWRPVGLSMTVRTASPLTNSGDDTVLRVVDALSAYRLVGRAGDVLAHAPARAPTAVDMTVRRVGAGWRIVAVVPQPTSAASAPSTSP